MSLIQDLFFTQKGHALSAPLETGPDGRGGLKTNVNGVLPWKLRSTSQTAKDIKHWKKAMLMWEAEERPRTYELQLLFDQVLIDGLLTSQIENRMNQSFNADFCIKNASGEIDEDLTKAVKKMKAFRQVCKSILMSCYRGYSMGEFKITAGIDGKPIINFVDIPRQNIVPREGLFYFDYMEDQAIEYRELEEYGSWILEFNSDSEFGIVNKAVPHVLFKKFAQSCWSELGEIYGIPPRTLKTNTQDSKMLTRAEKMMRDMGSAAWYIIDKSEEFEFANSSIKTSGEIFDNLIRTCNNENSMLISGAIVGQDTKNGSNAKEESSQDLLEELVISDMLLLEQTWNDQVIPAMVKIGLLPEGSTFEFIPAENLTELWDRVKEILPYAEVDGVWIKDKFGIEIVKMKSGSSDSEATLKRLSHFFG